jgi:hypothetical protein
MLESPPPPLEWEIEGLLLKRGILELMGRPKARKTFLAWQLALCKAAGIPFLGFDTGEPGSVLYLDEETGETLLFERFLANRAGHPALALPETFARFRSVSFQRFKFGDDRLRAQIEARKPSLTIFDSYRRMLPPGRDENDSGDTAWAFEWLSELRHEFDGAQAVIHHSKKNVGDGASWEDAARGSGDHFAVVDTMLGLTKREHGLATLRGTSRTGDIDPITLTFNPQTLLFELTTAKPAPGFNAEAVIADFLRGQMGGEAFQSAVQAHLVKEGGRTKYQAERILSKIPVVNRDAPPPEVRIGKELIRGSSGNQNRLFLVQVPS